MLVDEQKGLLPDDLYTQPRDIIEELILSKEEQDRIEEIKAPARGRTLRTHRYYESMRKNDPKKYSLASTQNQMFNDAIALGDKYKDGDYYKYGPDFYNQ